MKYKMDKKRILLVDDHEIFRNGARQLISQESDLEVVAEASDGFEAIEQAKNHCPDIVLMDISMPLCNGLESSQKLLSLNKNVRILFLSLYDREDYIMKALRMGAHGYILKDESNKVFLKAIRKVAAGMYYFSGDISNVIISNIRSANYSDVMDSSTEPPKKPEEGYRLSKRESQVLTEIAHGVNNKEISEKLSVSIRTIETHRQNIMRKFRVKTIEQSIQIAKNEGLI